MNAIKKGMTVAEYMTAVVDGSHKTQREIANAAGFEKPNIISMFKKGHTKVPIDKIPALAKGLEIDPAALFELVYREYYPETWEVIKTVMGFPTSRNERKIIEYVREVSNNSDPELSDNIKSKLEDIFSK